MSTIPKDQREKFVIRFDDEHTRSTISGIADQQHISMNAWILQAIDEKLARGKRIDRLLDAAEPIFVTSVTIDVSQDPDAANKLAESIKAMHSSELKMISGVR